MMPSGPPTPVGGGGQSALPSLLRSNSNLSSNSQQTYNSLVSPRTQFSNNGNSNSMNILGTISTAASLINQLSMPNGVGLQHFGNSEPDPHPFTPSQSQQLGGMHNFQQQNGSSSQNGSSQQPSTMRNMSPQNLQTMRGLGPVKREPQSMDSSTFLQQQQLMQMSRQSPQTAMQLNMLQQQQRIMQQQQLFKGLPPRAQMQQPQNGIPLRNQVKNSSYEPGICAKRLTQYMYYQKQRPEDNNIEFWRKFVAEFFASNAKKRWCVSLYGNGRQTNGVFPQDVWHCEICNRKPGRGFETTAEVLPRLCQIKYASGTLEELLYVDMPRESQNGMGQIVLDYPKAVQESVFEQLRVVRDGHLRMVFNPDLKIASWEFCARKHEELIPRRLIIPQVGQLGSVVQKYHNAAQNSPTGLSTQELQNNCNSNDHFQ